MNPLTPTGRGTVVLVVLGYPVGWWFGWIELVAIATAGLLALLLAVPFVIGQHSLEVTRLLTPDRVSVGDDAKAILTITNPAKAPIPKQNLVEKVGNSEQLMVVGPLGPGAEVRRVVELPTQRRGRIQVGPTTVSKADPLGLLLREVDHSCSDQLWIHPSVVPVSPIPMGFAKDLDGPTTDSSPAGDVSFHALKEYSIGDDPRHVHWLATARSGTLMVKHYVDNRRPHTTVVLDSNADVYSGEEFELAVSAAASLALAGLSNSQPTSLHFGCSPVSGSAGAYSSDGVLDQLSLIEPGEPEAIETQCSLALDREPDTSVLVLITGAVAATDLIEAVRSASRRTHVIVLRVWPDAEMELVNVPGATILDADSLERFSLVWKQALS